MTECGGGASSLYWPKEKFLRKMAARKNAENLRGEARPHIAPLRLPVATCHARCAHMHGRALAAIAIVQWLTVARSFGDELPDDLRRLTHIAGGGEGRSADA
jgi:hypothetical protein